MSRTVRVDLGERGYDIHIGFDLPLAVSLSSEKGISALIVSDSNVAPLYGDKCEASLKAQGIEVGRAVVPAGEASKDLQRVRELYDRAMDAGLDRASAIVALGGGMVGDLAGFVAATFLRGIRLVQIPTTLLAMVDSSVGGKTAVNIRQGKNLIGAFHQPIEVDADLSMLESLPKREYVSGLAEVVKYGVIWDAVLFKRLEEDAEKLLERDLSALEPVIARCCEIKAEVVAVDEKETGARSVLNFGHTLAHALEKVAGYGEILHGEAVSAGMVYAARLSARQKNFPAEDCDRLIGLLNRLGLPVSFPGMAGRASWQEAREAMAADKKARRKTPRFVLAERIGSVVFGCEVPEAILEKTWESV